MTVPALLGVVLLVVLVCVHVCVCFHFFSSMLFLLNVLHEKKENIKSNVVVFLYNLCSYRVSQCMD